MRKHLITILLCLALGLGATSVVSADFGKKAIDWRTDFAVPDAPAFKILNLDGSEIHRPTSVKDLAIAVSDFLLTNNSITLPQQLALEFSPGLLMGGKSLTIEKYRRNPWWYRTRISIATARDKESTTAIKRAIGLRSTSVDNSDLRMDTVMIIKATALAKTIIDYTNSLITGPIDNDAVNEMRQRPDVKAQIKEFEEEFRRELTKWTEKNWNARIDEFAFAFLFESQDSTSERLELEQFSAWYTSARGIGTSAQLLLGARASMTRKEFGSEEYDSKLTLSSRLYSGTNKAKIFAEGQFAAFQNQKSEWLFNSGGEMHLKDGFWIEFSAGGLYNSADKHTKLVTEFEIKYGL